MLLHRHGDRVLWLKGLHNVGEARGPLLVEGVQYVIHAPRHLGSGRSLTAAAGSSSSSDLDLAQVVASRDAFQDPAAAV